LIIFFLFFTKYGYNAQNNRDIASKNKSKNLYQIEYIQTNLLFPK